MPALVPRSGQSWDLDRFAVRPPLEPFRAELVELARKGDFPDAESLTKWVDEARWQHAADVMPLKFVELRPKPRRAKRLSVEVAGLYDARITCAREVPCLKQSYHDLFNALMFRVFPRSKRALHARQYEALLGWVAPSGEQLPGRRTREQDALTLFDEGGSVVLCRREQHDEFARGTRLPLCEPNSAATLVIFGHALFEHLSEGQLDLRSTARVFFVDELPEAGLLAHVDELLVGLLQDRRRFHVPDADAVVLFDQDGSVSFRRFDPAVRRSRAGDGAVLAG